MTQKIPKRFREKSQQTVSELLKMTSGFILAYSQDAYNANLFFFSNLSLSGTDAEHFFKNHCNMLSDNDIHEYKFVLVTHGMIGFS